MRKKWFQLFHLQRSHGISQYLTTTTTTTVPETKIPSKRQDFKVLAVHPSILSSIETLGIGIPPRKRRSRSLLPSSAKVTNRPSPPLPFGTKPRLVRQVGTSDTLWTGAAAAEKLKLPEVAIAGRSNVGKSTLLNALLFDAHKLRKGPKAAVSSRPGETHQIAIYELQQRLRIVDLPGYGFAYGKKTFQELVIGYLSHRGSVLKRVLLLIDSRHGMKTSDFQFLETLQEAPKVPPLQIVLTKCDEVKQMDLARRVAQVKQQLSDAMRREPKTLPVMLVSVKPPRQIAGVLELQKAISVLAKKEKEGGNESKGSRANDPLARRSSNNDHSDRVKHIWKKNTKSKNPVVRNKEESLIGKRPRSVEPTSTTGKRPSVQKTSKRVFRTSYRRSIS